MPKLQTRVTRRSPAAAATDALSIALPPDQRTALELLRAGTNITDAARDAGIDRRTIYRWLNHDPAFRAAYNQWQNELEESCRARLLALTGKAVDAVERSLEKGDAALALRVIRDLGINRPSTRRTTNPDEIRRRAAIAERERRFTLEHDERQVHLDDQISRKNDAEYEKGIVKLVKSEVKGGPEGQWRRLPRRAKTTDPLPSTNSLIALLEGREGPNAPN
jgi:hypothetical protein